MLKADVVRHFGTQEKVAKRLGIQRQAVQAWGEIIPDGRAWELQFLTDGVLQARPLKGGRPRSRKGRRNGK
jgi:transcriptional repressor of cell division inhibition gene dicB